MGSIRLLTKGNRAHSAVTRPNTTIGTKTFFRQNLPKDQFRTRDEDGADKVNLDATGHRVMTNVTNSLVKTGQSQM